LKTADFVKTALTLSMVWSARCTDTTPDAEGVQNALNEIMLEKAQRAGYYRAAALQAEKNGYAEVAVYLGEIAEEERGQSAKLSVFQAVVNNDTKKNLGTLITMEKLAADNNYPMLISLAKAEGNDSLSMFLAQMLADERRHAAGLKGILGRLK
jgi:rubrerythrin